jgi:putative ABC transport system permease protein
MIPLKYNVRNLRARATSTILTTLSTGIVVFSSCLTFGLVAGLQHSLKATGEPTDLIVFRQGSTNENDGAFDVSKADDLLNIPGIARDAEGRPLAAREIIQIPAMERVDGSRANLTVRGIEEASPALRPKFQIVAGRMLIPGRDECIVSPSISRRFKGARLGDLLRMDEKEAYRVVGLFTAGGSSAESEVWVDRKDLERKIAREGVVSSVQIRAPSIQAREAIRRTIETDTRFRLKAVPEPEYFSQTNDATRLLQLAGTLIAVLLTIGAMFAAVNTMFAAVAARTREIGTMRALGFSRAAILASFLSESVLLCALGGIAGLLATLPLNSMRYSTMSNFTEVSFAFRFDTLVMGVAFAMTLAMGIFGGLFPALRAVRMDVISALREL